MAYTLSQIAETMLGQIAEIVSGSSEAPSESHTLLTWCAPGIPSSPENFTFAARGLGTGKTAEEENAMTNQAARFAELVDFIPDVAAADTGEKQRARLRRESGVRLSTTYEQILRASRVRRQDLTEDEKKDLERLRGLLRVTKKRTNLATQEEEEYTADSPLVTAYNDRAAAYEAAAITYNNAKSAAQGASGELGKQAVADFRNNGQLYLNRVRRAMSDWVANGYKNDYEQITARINQYGLRDMSVWKQHLLDLFDEAVLTSTEGVGFRFTTMIPGDFATAGGWTRYSVNHEYVDSGTHTSTGTLHAKVGIPYGLWNIGASGEASSSDKEGTKTVDSFKLTMELAQTVISRPWFYPELFRNRGWTIDPKDWPGELPLSNGDPRNPKGSLIGYPTSVLWVRNVKIESSQFSEAVQEHQRKFGGDVSIGWGPFTLSGGGSLEHNDAETHTKTDGQSVTVDGMQIIGFVNRLIEKAPDPADTDPSHFQ